MKRTYKKPLSDIIEMTENAGVMQAGQDASAGQINPGGGDVLGKENTFVWDEAPFNLWENDEDDDNLWNNE